MKMYSILILLCLFSISSYTVFASDKEILQIPYCYNVSIHAIQLTGNHTDINFRDCSKLDSYHFSCDCHNVVGIFNLTLQTDSPHLDSIYWRRFRFDVSYNTYTLAVNSGNILITDYGDGFNVIGNNIEYSGFNIITINKPVYIDREVPIYINNISNVTTYVDNIIYINQTIEHNNTILEPIFINGQKALFNNYTFNCDKESKEANVNFVWMFVYAGFCVILLIILVIVYLDKFGRRF